MNIYDFKINDANGDSVSMEDYNGKVLLIVNTATRCGFTPQYNELEKIYEIYRDKGFEILDFPCNQFHNQAPESQSEIASFCQINFGLKFKQFEKIEVNGDNASPLFKFLKSQKKGLGKGEIKWNFTKFLIDKNGRVLKRFAPTTKPSKIEKYIKELL